MIELSPKKLIERVGKPSWHSRDWSTDPSSDGLQSPTSSPGRGCWRWSKSSWFRSRLSIWLTTILVIIAVFSLWSWSRDESEPQDDSEEIPLGQSRGREVFWWEQFPRLHGFYRGLKTLIPLSQYTPEQDSSNDKIDIPTNPSLSPVNASLPRNIQTCYLDDAETQEAPRWSAYIGLPAAMSAPLFGSHNEIGLNLGQCYDRISRLGPYGIGFREGEWGFVHEDDNENESSTAQIDHTDVKWAKAQQRCCEKNRPRSRSAFVIRTWQNFQYTPWHISMLRAIISELSIASGGEYDVHFLIHVQDEHLPIWASDELFDRVLRESMPEEFYGMGTLWSVGQMKLIYPPPFPKSVVNFSGGNIYDAYRSLNESRERNNWTRAHMVFISRI